MLSASTPLSDPKAERVVARLHARDRRQFRRAIPHFVGAYVRTKLTRRPYKIDGALPELDVLRPKLRLGSIVLCDNTEQFAREYADYLAYVRAPEHGFRTTTIPGNGGLELSVVV